MFEAAELGHSIDKETYRKELPALRKALLEAQFELAKRSTFPVIILVAGVDGAGKGETINTLNEWLDPRQIETNALSEPSDEESERPSMWRFWRALPPKGKIGIFFGSWYTGPILDRVEGSKCKATLETAQADILRFERMLADEGVLLLKFWFHLRKQQQKKRLRALEKDKRTRWRVTPQDWQRYRRYDCFRRVSETMLEQTSTGHAPWIVVDGSDERYRSLLVGKTLLQGLRKRLSGARAGRNGGAGVLAPSLGTRNVLDALDLSVTLAPADYARELERWQGRLNAAARSGGFAQRGAVLVFEGHDAAGKGGAIRRIAGALDARHYRVVPIAAPSDEERAQPYLWRFWRHLPRRGHMTIFDRSWYGRVLVERVEGYAEEANWLRAYAEINEFEAEIARHGLVIVKFWLAISKQEQYRRFKEREATGFKRFKLTEEDWRNRKKWNAYAGAVHDMVERTNSELAPWTLVEANDKYHARIKILRTLTQRLEAAK